MKIYRIKEDNRQYGKLELSNDLLLEAFGRMAFDDIRESDSNINDRWPNCSGAYYEMYSTQSKFIENTPDIYIWNDTCLALSPRAKNSLTKMLSIFGEFLPFDHHGTEYFIFSCHSIADATSDSEEIIETGVPVGIKRLNFQSESVGTNPLFKTEFDDLSNLYCNQNFKQTVEKNALSGLIFYDKLEHRYDELS